MSSLIKRQLEFFARKRAGCLFAAVAARRPAKYGWVHRIIPPHSERIDMTIQESTSDPEVTTLSMLFPSVSTIAKFGPFLGALKTCTMLTLEQEQEYEGTICLGFRAKIGHFLSYVTGFGNFTFLPKTRRAPYVELTIRVKPRPKYDYIFKEAPPNVIHLADLDMKGMPLQKMQMLWKRSFDETERVIGKKPDLRSAAKTTYSVPPDLYSSIP